MKFFKLCLLFISLILSVGLVPLKNENLPLSEKELTDIFPDSNFRNVIHDYFLNEDITITKLKSLNGEFYASGENIKDLRGISTLENINTFILWNNNIDKIPKEVLNLDKVKYINIENNYLVENNVINSLKNKNVKVDCDLNFIHSERSQYELCSNKTRVDLNKNEKLNLRSLLYKSIDKYVDYWEPTNNLSKHCKLYVQTNNPTLTHISSNNDNVYFNKNGTYYIVISLSPHKYPSSTVIIKAIVK